MSSNQLWYTRRDREIRGPFPAGQITRDILLGRILQTDQLSTDQLSWYPVTDLPDLIPSELKADLTLHENREKLRLARYREDERRAGDRRKKQSDVSKSGFKSRGPDRRKPESFEALRHRELKSNFLVQMRERNQQKQNAGIIALTLIIIVAVCVASLIAVV